MFAEIETSTSLQLEQQNKTEALSHMESPCLNEIEKLNRVQSRSEKVNQLNYISLPQVELTTGQMV